MQKKVLGFLTLTLTRTTNDILRLDGGPSQGCVSSAVLGKIHNLFDVVGGFTIHYSSNKNISYNTEENKIT